MLLLPSLAKKIIYEVKKLIDEDIIIVNTDGTIIASTDEKRLGTFHEGALLSVKERRKFIITKEDEQRLEGVKPGLNLPIFFSHDVIGVIGITGDPDRILPYGELLKRMTELLIQESYHSDQLQWRSRMLEAFVFDWLQLKEWSKPFIDRANLLKVDLQADRQLILAYLHEHQTFLNEDIWQLIHVWNGEHGHDLFVRWGNDRFLIIQHAQQNMLKEATLQKVKQLKAFIEETWNTSASFGIGQTVEGHALKKSYEQAERALTVAMRENSIIFDADLRLEMCLEDISLSTRKEFIGRVLDSVLGHEELLETFRVFFQQNMSLKQTAEILHIHINTLHYRIKKMEELTGLNLKHFPDVVSLYLSLYFLDNRLKNEE
ncbi:MAG TPA: sugar diacid recognition domain-containing protein [Bacillus sp. (in: firmicutes)]|nr:sugar diacid recognition domain-containing protein [Bacillus sp. (in: firmicutes)]